MMNTISLLEQSPDLGQCLQHGSDITSICTKCQNFRYFCPECKHCQHNDQSGKMYMKQLEKQLMKIQVSDQSMRQEIAKQMTILIEEIDKIQIKIQNAFHSVKSINTNQCQVFLTTLSLQNTELSPFLHHFSQNPQQIHKIINTLSDTQLNYPMLVKQLPKYIQNIKKQLQTLGKHLQNIITSSKKITTAIKLTQISQKISNNNFNIITPSQQLKTLSLFNKHYFPMQILQQIKKNKPQSIYQLDLQKNVLNSGDLKIIFNHKDIHFINLRKLNLSNNNLDNNCLNILLQSDTPKLQSINLSGNKIEMKNNIADIINQKWKNLEEIIS